MSKRIFIYGRLLAHRAEIVHLNPIDPHDHCPCVECEAGIRAASRRAMDRGDDERAEMLNAEADKRRDVRIRESGEMRQALDHCFCCGDAL